MLCLHCQKALPSGESKFCSPACRAEFARTMPEAISCYYCDAQADGILSAEHEGWTRIEADPEGSSWNYLGLCPECREREGGDP